MIAYGPDDLAVSDITLLVDSRQLGRRVVADFADRNVHCINTFETDGKEARRRKLVFFMGDARIKATTLHSFKGWETRALVICVEHARDHRALALLYAGLTRLKQHPQGSFLTVVCAAPGLADYGSSWPEFVSREETRAA
jgi:hypothetical protein